MSKSLRIKIGLISNLIICLWGIYRMFSENALAFIPVILVAGVFIGFIASIYELKKSNTGKYQG
ncbi:hypothetical protein SAMN05421743_101466 [Thalassobacillus cyri]|uniref:Uncharacterized protein n=1 Tax=Thalassobacillus cyri TaxID=571932 RepID=A0A1H3WHJ7_9BACI|nr:hypothetical protein [Thalassobacillus cyri]SDZ86583.1 hypothetical protein SAMN05421743_101466 [Thalassobacillus cyri]